MMESGTAALRKAAPEWSLAGDKNLLQVLEDLHEKLMTKCQEVNTKLDDMVNKLDNASVDLQNVNNKFLALSNSQFIESRVYDDDITSDGKQEKKEEVPVKEENELSKIKQSLQTFERMHEAVRILDSDSSDDEDDFSTILKPKDMYSDRPLPYIIGSHQWKAKWHVGLAPSESDSDSSEEYAKRTEPKEQYSESEFEDEETYQKEAAHVSSSSEVGSEPSPGPSGVVNSADVAAQIAKRLAAQQPAVDNESRASSIPESGPRKVYRAEQPGTIPVFSEEPPPLDDTFDDYNDNYSDEDDIFAELHRKPSKQTQSESRAVDPFVEQLFGGDIKRDESKPEGKVPSPVDTPILLKNNSKTNLLSHQQSAKSNDIDRKEQTIKKPVGGMSLFGSSEGAESIGAAILKRNQRKSSSSDDDDKAVEENTQADRKASSIPISTNKIIEDLFTKPKSSKKEIITGKTTATPITQKITQKPKIDLFSDNIFDDVDDIFTSEIVTRPKETNQKSIFDDDNLFTDVPTKAVAKDIKKKSIFDSDDELFKEDVNESTRNNSKKAVKINETIEKKNTAISIFDDDNESGDIFASNNTTPTIVQSQTDYTPTQIKNDNHGVKTVNINLFDQTEPNIQKTQTTIETLNPTLQPKKFESPLLFDDDDVDDLFINNMSGSKIKESNLKNIKHEVVFDDENVLKAANVNKDNNNKALEPHVTQGTDLVVNDTESEEYLFNLPKSSLPQDSSENTPDSVLKMINNSDSNSNNIKNFVTENSVMQNTKNDHEDTEEMFDGTKNYIPVTDTNDYLPNDSACDENINSLNDVTTTESFTSSQKHQQKQHDEPDDLFSDVPPIFEKPSEPKKSKNVNALFDDDSDDEALFFRKSDVTEEKPKALYNDNRFSIFHDEPPDVDIDFFTKTDNTLKSVDSHEDLFTLPTSNFSSENTVTVDNKPRDDKLSDNNKQVGLLKETQDNLNIRKDESLDISKLLSSEIIETDSHLSSSISKPGVAETKRDPNPNIISEQIKDLEMNIKKSVGKLKPMNININVHSLLPGASPTKQKSKDESDGSAYSSQSNEELNKCSEKEESKMVKSVSFDGDPGSEVLDNKLSKGRARIQVKRRPSSRRARLEAVRKSGIDFADDSTDNSSSFDEPKPVSFDYRSSERGEVPVSSTSSSDNVNSRTENTESDVATTKKFKNEDNISTEIKSKTVYILHDEDIFSNSPNTKTDNTKKTLTILDDDDDDEDLFKNPAMSAKNNKRLENDNFMNKINRNNSEITKEILQKQTKSIFDDLSDDDELFGGKSSSETTSTNVKSKNTNKGKQKLASIKTGSLFGDDSDDDDLFKTTKITEVKSTKTKVTPSISATAIKGDPLSMFDDS